MEKGKKFQYADWNSNLFHEFLEVFPFTVYNKMEPSIKATSLIKFPKIFKIELVRRNSLHKKIYHKNPLTTSFLKKIISRA